MHPHMCTHTQTHTHMPAYTYAHAHTHTHACIYIRTRTHAIQACIRSYTHQVRRVLQEVLQSVVMLHIVESFSPLLGIAYSLYKQTNS